MANSVAIIDYDSGNLHSIVKACEYVAPKGTHIVLTDQADAIHNASHIILPGVGAFADCMAGLAKKTGVLDAITKEAQEHHKPFLGICVGMQMLLSTGYEHGTHQGLGWIEGSVKKITPNNNEVVPHMGWNTLDIKQSHAIVSHIQPSDHLYFVHSYQAHCTKAENILATTEYGGQEITAVIAKDNVMGTQFHPEKSSHTGLELLKQFISQ